jgi:two-component system chemotaxis sensor kinase CheA
VPLKDSLDRIAEHYLLEDFSALPAALATLGANLTHPAERESIATLAAAAQALASDPTPGARESFEAALTSLQAFAEQPAAASAPAPSSSSVLSQDPGLVGDFLLEAREHLQIVERGLLVIEKDPSHRDTLHSVFRSFHTIKGLAGFLEFGAIQDVSHEVETILDMARNGQIVMTTALIDLTLDGADFVQRETNRIEAELHGELIPPTDPAALLVKLRAAAQAPAPELEALGQLREETTEETTEESAEESVTEETPVVTAPPALPATPTAKDEPTPPAAPVSPAVAVSPAVPVSPAVAVSPAVPVSPSAAVPEAGPRRAAATENFAIRVDTAKLDYLLDMVGEMVIAESMVRLDPEISTAKNARLQRNLTQLRRVTEEVQKVAMATRLIPVGALFQRVNRLVRDTSRKAGKLAEVEFFGEETQLDKTIIEELTDPIMHMVRNSIDHGIETPEARAQAGKPAAGKIQLKAYRQADHIQIEIVDDGRGLNQERILNKALERGLISEGAALSGSEIFQLIFEPGFSTAEKVTDLSGRGVGMDVVKKQIQKLRGKIDIQSRPGCGTTFFLKLPLTLAIIEGLVIGVGRERYIVPIFSVQEMFRPAEGQVNTVQGKVEMVMVRNALLPVVRLEDSLGVRGSRRPTEEGLMIVAETEGKRFVLLVDEFIGKQEVVIKNLGNSLKNTPGIAGGAILGDGRVGLILDLEAIYRDRHHRAEGEDSSARGPLKQSVCVTGEAAALA